MRISEQAAPREARAQPDRDLVTASALKLATARVLTSHQAGRVIGTLTGKRIRHHGLWFDTSNDAFSPRVRAQMFWGIYESAETRAIGALLRNSETVIELGSSLGVTSAHIADRIISGGRLICVEANPALVSRLQESLSRRFPEITIDVVHAAIAAHCGQASLSLSSQTAGSRMATSADQAGTNVPALTLQELVRRMDVTEFDLVSDIEGAEACFLLRDPSPLAGCRRMVMELHDTSVDGHQVTVHDLLESTRSAGFRVVRRHGPVVGLRRDA